MDITPYFIGDRVYLSAIVALIVSFFVWLKSTKDESETKPTDYAMFAVGAFVLMFVLMVFPGKPF